MTLPVPVANRVLVRRVERPRREWVSPGGIVVPQSDPYGMEPGIESCAGQVLACGPARTATGAEYDPGVEPGDWVLLDRYACSDCLVREGERYALVEYRHVHAVLDEQTARAVERCDPLAEPAVDCTDDGQDVDPDAVGARARGADELDLEGE